MQKTTLLIDGDILCYMAACSVEERTNWGDGIISVRVGDPRDAEAHIRRAIDALHDKLEVSDGIVCLSCPTADGWRAKVLPTYKAHRDPKDNPQLLGHVKDYVRRRYKVKETPTLEADDVMGILSTHPRLVPGKKIIVSSDKDMKTIPGWYYSPYHDQPVRQIGEAEADYWHLYQTLVGDATDGYKGCPGIGPAAAVSYLTEKIRPAPYPHWFTRGPRKGTHETRWEDLPSESAWATVVALFNKAGLTEADALIQARVARICRHTDYDYKRKEVKLWNPSTQSDSAGSS